MYEAKFQATNDADWAESIELIDDSNSGPLAAAADASFVLEVSERGCGATLKASTADATITKPASNIIQWRFTAAQMNTLRSRHTYNVGCTMTADDGSVTQLLVGTLAIINGNVDADD